MVALLELKMAIIKSRIGLWAGAVVAVLLTAGAAMGQAPAAAGAGSAPVKVAGEVDWKPIAARVEEMTRAEFAKRPVGALSVGLIANGAVVWTGHFGHVDGPESAAPDGATVYRIGSITKNFTALALLKLEGENRCGFSDPIGKWFPEFSKVPDQPPSGTQPTLIQLATHMGGLAREPDDPKEELDIGAPAEWETILVRMVPKMQFAAEPGVTFRYSNVGYALLGSAIGKAAGVPYTSYVTEKILKPLGMNDTVFELSAEQRKRVAVGHMVEGDSIETERARKELEGRGYRVPNGGLLSTLDDMCKWTRLQMGEAVPAVIDPQTLADSRRRLVTVGPKLGLGYCLGVQVRRMGETVMFGHNGGTPGYQADFMFNPETKVGIVMLRSALGNEFDTNAIINAALVAEKKEGK